jgi:hypothetical protein
LAQLVSYRSTVITPDTAEALRLLEKAAANLGGVRLEYWGVSREDASWAGVAKNPGPTGLPSALSLRPAGREVYLRAHLKDFPGGNPREQLATLWSLAIPLGFVPWSRFPVPGDCEQVFHFLGPWARLGDTLQGEGKGEHVWPSICAAAQSDVGKWEGPKPTEHLIQTNLHRLGVGCGPVDGVVGERTLGALRAMGLGGVSSESSVEALATLLPPKVTGPGDKSVGVFTFRGPEAVEPFSSGKVRASRIPTGIAVEVSGPGRLILLFGGFSQ